MTTIKDLTAVQDLAPLEWWFGFSLDELTALRKLADDGYRNTSYAEFEPRDPKEPRPDADTLALRELCKRLRDELPAREDGGEAR